MRENGHFKSIVTLKVPQQDNALAMKYKIRLETQLETIFQEPPAVVVSHSVPMLYKEVRGIAYQKLLEHIKQEEDKLGKTCQNFANSIQRLLDFDKKRHTANRRNSMNLNFLKMCGT